MERLADAHDGEDVVVAIAHGGTIRAVAHCLRIRADNALRLSLQNLSLTQVERHTPVPAVVCVNEVAGY